MSEPSQNCGQLWPAVVQPVPVRTIEEGPDQGTEVLLACRGKKYKASNINIRAN